MRKFIPCILILTAVVSGCSPMNIFYGSPANPEGPFFAETEDGWKIAIYRHPSKNTLDWMDPVILCHGNALNNYFWHLDSTHNFAQYLAKRRYDVWLVDLRGHGRSRLSNPFAGEYIGDNVVERDPYDWTLEDYALRDLDTIITEVLKRTGKKRVTWIGHSMGGMVMYARLGLVNDERVSRFAAISSPVVLPTPPTEMLHEAANLDAGLQDIIEKRTMASILQNMAVLKTVLMTPLDVLYYNRDNMRDDTIVRFYANAIENIPPRVNEQLGMMIKTGKFLSPDKKTVYPDLLKNITIPILMVCGKSDELAPPAAIHFAYNNVGSKDKTLHIFTRANKHLRNYGHCDIINGLGAETEVFPFIYKWLRNQSKKTAIKRRKLQQQK